MRLVAALLVALLVPVTSAVPVLDNDAGSGADAPSTTAGAVPVTPGTLYDAAFAANDFADVYSFTASNGDALSASVWPGAACIAFLTPSGFTRASSCTAGSAYSTASTTANATGTWFVSISQPVTRVPQPYRFSVGVTTVAPDPSLGGDVLLGSPVHYIQPGQEFSTALGSCTLNFAYNGTGAKAGRVFVGAAAHCFTGLGQSASAPGLPAFGTVVYMGDYSYREGSYNNGIPGTQVDFALIEVDSAYYSKVKGEVLGHPGMPTAVKAHSAVRVGDRFDFSGNGVGFAATKPTREMRFGIYHTGNTGNWGAIAPILPGDSGGPVLHQDGRAVGVVAYLGGFGVGGPWLDTAMTESGAAGWPIALRPAY